MIPAVILGLVPRIQPSTSAGASGWKDGRDEPDHDNPGYPLKESQQLGDTLARPATDAALDIFRNEIDLVMANMGAPDIKSQARSS
jgi:hypothetical protein